MKNKITSILIFPYANKLEIKVSRGLAYNRPIETVRVYSANYTDKAKVKRLAQLASKMIELNTIEMIRTLSFSTNPLR